MVMRYYTLCSRKQNKKGRTVPPPTADKSVSRGVRRVLPLPKLYTNTHFFTSRSDTAFLFAQNLLKALKGAGSSVHSGLKKEVSSYGRRY